ALALLGLMSPTVRLPLVGLSDPHRAELRNVLLRLCDEHSEQMLGSVETAPANQRVALGLGREAHRVITCRARTAQQTPTRTSRRRVEWCPIACLSTVCLTTLRSTRL